MNDNQMWFGNPNYMQWVRCPGVDSEFTRSKWGTTTQYLNGGAYARNSVTDHKEYSLNWARMSRAESRQITDYANGVYGDDLIYFIDPFAADVNVAPMPWAFPALGTMDGPILDGTYTRPTATPTPANTLGYPLESAVYNITTASTYGVWLPVPPGYILWVGAHGSSSGGTVTITLTVTGGGETTATTLTLLGVADSTRVNYAVSGGAYSGAYLRLAGSGLLTLSGIIAQVLPEGQNPETGGYLSGQGHSGCRFVGAPTEEQYSAYYDAVGLTASLVEVGAWL